MKTFIKLTFLITALLSLLTACFGPESPQDVSVEFWQAVVNNNAREVSEYSTLSSAEAFDGFARDWSGAEFSWGRVIIDADQATIESAYTLKSQSPQQARNFTTYLVRTDRGWLVDYSRTAASVNGGVLGELFNTFDRFGKELSRQLNRSSQETSVEMERMMQQLETRQQEITERVSEALEEYAEDLNDVLEELEESINDALQEQQNQLSEDDQYRLRSAAYELRESRNSLDEESPLSIASSSLNMAAVQQKLDAVEAKSLSEYQQDWHKMINEFSDDMESFLQELSAE